MLGFGSKLRVGLDIGSHSIKAVAIEKSGNKFRLLARAQRPIFGEGTDYNPDGPKRSQVVPLLVDLFREIKVTPKKLKNLRSCVSGAQVAAKEIIALPLSSQEMHSAMVLEARKHMPLDGSETQVDFMIMGEDVKEPEKVRVLLAATTKNVFNAHLETLKEINLSPVVVDIEPLAMANSWMMSNELPEDGVVVMMNIGNRKTTISVIGRKDLFFTRDIPVGGHSFTEELMRNYGLSYHEAEKVKREQGLTPNLPKAQAEEGGLRLATKSVVDRFGEEVNRTLRYYVKETSQSMFAKIVLFGGGAALKEVQDSLSSKFNISVEPFDPFARLEIAGGGEDGHPAQYAAAVGLAIREAQ